MPQVVAPPPEPPSPAASPAPELPVEACEAPPAGNRATESAFSAPATLAPPAPPSRNPCSGEPDDFATVQRWRPPILRLLYLAMPVVLFPGLVAGEGEDVAARALSLWRTHWVPRTDWTAAPAEGAPGLVLSQVRLQPVAPPPEADVWVTGLVEHRGREPIARAGIEVHDPVSGQSWWHALDGGARSVASVEASPPAGATPWRPGSHRSFALQVGPVADARRLILRLHGSARDAAPVP